MYFTLVSPPIWKKECTKHQNKVYPDSFSAKYNVNELVYYQGFDRIEDAINREKQIKGGSRKSKMELIHVFNPQWKNLYKEVMEW